MGKKKEVEKKEKPPEKMTAKELRELAGCCRQNSQGDH
jgi:hypothetical protein